jgi:hypothetical protein
MTTPIEQPRKATARDLFYFTHPQHWPTWPFLPVVRRHADGELECGLLFDLLHLRGRTGYSCTIFKCNIFQMPPTEDEFLALPKETFDTPEEMAAAGWVVD